MTPFHDTGCRVRTPQLLHTLYDIEVTHIMINWINLPEKPSLFSICSMKGHSTLSYALRHIELKSCHAHFALLFPFQVMTNLKCNLYIVSDQLPWYKRTLRLKDHYWKNFFHSIGNSLRDNLVEYIAYRYRPQTVADPETPRGGGANSLINFFFLLKI